MRTRVSAPVSPELRLSAVALRRRLLGWYRRHRRDLPWRGTRDPYRVWVSEAMLQQTQVAAALRFYQKFLERFPTLDSLARARPESVLAAWAGLGYYRRARHLHEAARVVVREHGGQVPDDQASFSRLPGVGRYTTGAVLSIAFDRPLPVLDGNVARVFSRLFALEASHRTPAGARALWEIAERLVPRRGAGDWNQALMELGARVCVPRAPRCGVCPVRSACRAFAAGRVGELPPVAPRRAAVTHRRAVALLVRRGRMLVSRREGPLLHGLWEPPGVDLGAREHAGRSLKAELGALGIHARLDATSRVVRHGITFRRIEARVWRATLLEPMPRSRRLRFEDPRRPRVALTALARKLGSELES